MKAVIIREPHKLELIDIEKPVMNNDNDIIVKMKVAGVCASDVHIYHGTNAAATYPRIIGHEMVGEVVEIGEKVSKVKLGDRVIIDQIVSCGNCYACKKNRSNVCGDLKVRGVHISGGFQEFISVCEDDAYLLPENLSYEEAVMIEPTTIAMQSCSRANLEADDTLLILGCGALGTTLIKIAKLTGATIIAADIFDEKLNQAIELGADYAINISDKNLAQECKKLTNGYGVTVSIDSACTKETLSLLLEATGNAGRVITMGFSEEISEITQFKITSKELDVRGSRLQNKKFPEAIKLVKDEKINFKGSVSHKFKLEDAQKAFDLIDSKDKSIKKVVITFD